MLLDGANDFPLPNTGVLSPNFAGSEMVDHCLPDKADYHEPCQSEDTAR